MSECGMQQSAATGLERGYRRLLAWYPRDYWRDHEDEMLAVLLASARDGQRRPGLAESGDLIRGALVMRFRPRGPAPADAGWRDALAVFSAAAPLLLVFADVIVLAASGWHPRLTGFHQAPWASSLIRPDVQLLNTWAGLRAAAAGQLAVAAAVLLRLRRVALAVIAVSVLYWIFSNGTGSYLRSPWEMFAMSFYALEAAALAASPGPRRGLRLLLTWRRGLILAVAAAATGIFWKLTYGIYLSSAPVAQRAAAGIVLGAVAIGMVLSSRLGRHLVVLFAIMFYPVALALARETGSVPLPAAMAGSWQALMYLPPALLAAMAIASSRRSGDGTRPPASPDTSA